MKRDIIIALACCLLAVGCSEKKGNTTKNPIKVKTQLLSPGFVDNAQTYVGIVEEREATAVSFTSMGVVKRVLVSEGQAVGRGQLIAEIDDTLATRPRNCDVFADALWDTIQRAWQDWLLTPEFNKRKVGGIKEFCYWFLGPAKKGAADGKSE